MTQSLTVQSLRKIVPSRMFSLSMNALQHEIQILTVGTQFRGGLLKCKEFNKKALPVDFWAGLLAKKARKLERPRLG
jgi:hypothetical protein